MAAQCKKFRTTFKISKELLQWYPGHMNHSFKHMQAKMRTVDLVIEVHDSRIPFSGRNPLFIKNLVGAKPHILVLNKVDLIDVSNRVDIEEKFQNDCDTVIFTNCLNQKCKGLKSILPKVIDLINNSLEVESNALKYKVMVVGIPNVGKSSLINALRNVVMHKGRATPVGGVPGVTKSVMNEIKICHSPLIYLIDTPGILIPNILSVECGMKLVLCSCIKDDIVGAVTIADFLLYWLNKTRNFTYVKLIGLEEPSDDIIPILIKIAIDQNKTKKVKNITNNSVEVVPDVHYAASFMVSLFRKGKLGDIYLDRNME